jgi:hypothetical protein
MNDENRKFTDRLEQFGCTLFGIVAFVIGAVVSVGVAWLFNFYGLRR